MYLMADQSIRIKNRKGETVGSTILGDFTNPLPVMDRTSRQKIVAVNSSINQLYLTGMYRTLYPTTRYTFFK